MKDHTYTRESKELPARTERLMFTERRGTILVRAAVLADLLADAGWEEIEEHEYDEIPAGVDHPYGQSESTRPDEALIDVARDCGLPPGLPAPGWLRGQLEDSSHLIPAGVTYVTAETADEIRRLAREVWPERRALQLAREAAHPAPLDAGSRFD